MKRVFATVCAAATLLVAAGPLWAHFGMLIPSDSMVMPGESKEVRLIASFSHPMEGMGMEMARPLRFGVLSGGNRISLLNALRETRVMGRKAWAASHRITRPGVYTFYLEPEPYWEPAEDCFIVHHTKTTIAAFGDESGWEEPVGLETEIVPLTRPFGLYAGNLFQGVVLLQGRPVPGATVEVEYDNRDGRVQSPTDYMITQVTRTDRNGVFSFSVPGAGWWGFAALSTAERKIPRGGAPKAVELGAVLWVLFHDWQEKK